MGAGPGERAVRYIHWPLDITPAALAEVEKAVRAHISYMQDDNARVYHSAQKAVKKPEYRFPVQRITELLNIANEARAMLQKLPPKPEEDDLLA